MLGTSSTISLSSISMEGERQENGGLEILSDLFGDQCEYVAESGFEPRSFFMLALSTAHTALPAPPHLKHCWDSAEGVHARRMSHASMVAGLDAFFSKLSPGEL